MIIIVSLCIPQINVLGIFVYISFSHIYTLSFLTVEKRKKMKDEKIKPLWLLPFDHGLY